jgi:hypothetical protein
MGLLQRKYEETDEALIKKTEDNYEMQGRIA